MVRTILVLWFIAALISIVFAERANAIEPLSKSPDGVVHIDVYGSWAVFSARKGFTEIADNFDMDLTFHDSGSCTNEDHCIIVSVADLSAFPADGYEETIGSNCYIWFDPSEVPAWATNRYRKAVAEHEFGHCLGLEHDKHGLMSVNNINPKLYYHEYRTLAKCYSSRIETKKQYLS